MAKIFVPFKLERKWQNMEIVTFTRETLKKNMLF